MAGPADRSLQGIIDWVNSLHLSTESSLIASGIGVFAGAGDSTTIDFTPSAPSHYVVIITPHSDPLDGVGEFWFEQISDTQFKVYNTGTDNTATFLWAVGAGPFNS